LLQLFKLPVKKHHCKSLHPFIKFEVRNTVALFFLHSLLTILFFPAFLLTRLMKNNSDKELITLLARVYNHSIQYYYHFPEVIIYGTKRLEAEDFTRLLTNNFIEAHYTDSFGKLYHLSKKGEEVLHQSIHTKKRKAGSINYISPRQCSLQFF
jgi:hypothetical protein